MAFSEHLWVLCGLQFDMAAVSAHILWWQTMHECMQGGMQLWG